MRHIFLDLVLAMNYQLNRTPLGFTLIELMITVALVAILSTLAYSAYTSQVQKTARKEAIGNMLEIAGRLEQYRSQKFTYPLTADVGAFAKTTKRYQLAVQEKNAGQGYKIVATPAIAQSTDLCGTMTYENPGVWSFSPTTTLTSADCL